MLRSAITSPVSDGPLGRSPAAVHLPVWELNDTTLPPDAYSRRTFATQQGEHGMSLYEVHTVDTAPQGSKPLLESLQGAIGMIPNLAAAMTEYPESLRWSLAFRQIYYGVTFSPGDIQVLALTNAFENGCRYCMALHSAFALEAGVSIEAVEALRAGRSPEEPRLNALS